MAFWNLFLLRTKLVEENPASRSHIRDFATAENLLALVHLELGKLEQAENLLMESLSYRQRLHLDEPDDAHAAFLYGLALLHMGRPAAARGEHREEAIWVRRAAQQLTNVDATWPGVSFIVDALVEAKARLDELGE
jgi:tetratricopeptide (TPR) repeat protein